jgi:transcriptional regulator with XRE-family HTH domain
MADFRTELGIGKRIAAARKQRGMSTARDLADAIPVEAISEAVIQNIEAGRKVELSVSQLLNIAHALRVPPLFLLAPVGLPLYGPDVPNLGPDLQGMSTIEFDAWLTGAPDGAYRWKTKDERAERAELQAMRELHQQLQERRRLHAILEIEKEDNLTENQMNQQTWESTPERIANVQRRIDQLESYLTSAGWDLDGWAA